MPKPAIEFPGRSPETGAICNALACRGVTAPHTGKPYSDALLFGVSGGIAFGYFLFQYKGWPAHVSLLTHNTFDPYQHTIDRLGIIQESKETIHPERGLANLLDALDNGSPAIVWADMYSLSYNNLPNRNMIWAVVPLLVHGYDGASFHIAGGSKKSLKVPAAELTAARARVKKQRFRIATLSPPDPKKLPAAVTAGIRQCIALFEGEGAPRGFSGSFGFDGLQKWADMIVDERTKTGWARVFPTGAGLFQALAGTPGQPGIFGWIMTWGAAPNAERGLFASFLEEAADILRKPALLPIAAQFRESASLWHTLAETALPTTFPVLKKARTLLLRQHEAFIEKGQAAAATRATIRARLEECAKEAADTLDPASAAIRQLKTALHGQILYIRETERDAIQQLRRIIS